MKTNEKLCFASDYMKGAHPAVLKALTETNLIKTKGYGLDSISEQAREKIRKACGKHEAQVFFLVGGTQTNAVLIDAFLESYQGVIASESGHISSHEAGAIEASGHKVLCVPHESGKLQAETIRRYLKDFYDDENHEHIVAPGMVYISHPSEYGTLYKKEELKEIRAVCDEYKVDLYLDGARLAYALACPENDLTLRDLAELCDAFYIGGTKCGALFGEALVIPDPKRVPHLFSIIKQHGALVAKGRVLGVQFDTLFSDDLYLRIGENAIKKAAQIRDVLIKKDYRLPIVTPTNQIFITFANDQLKSFAEKVDYGFWEKYDEDHTVIRLATDWGTTDEEIRKLIDLL